MNVLVAVASKHGSTREIAATIAEVLRAAQLTVDLREAGDVGDIGGYEAIVLGSAIYAGSWCQDAKQFAERHRAALAGRPVWLFSSGPLGDPSAPTIDNPQVLAAALGEVAVRDHRVFDGKLDKHILGLGERLIVKAVKAPYGDFRDWPAIRNWAEQIAAALATPAVAVV